jgi:hypothetical protein
MIERETLLKIARETAAQRMQVRRSLISAYLAGSVAAGEPLLGDATDIDLILIDADTPSTPREVLRLTDQVALDLSYRAKAEYAHPKELRVHPWLGPEMCEPICLHDPTHFFELAQSSARGQFHRPDHVAVRARTFAVWAREALHVGLLPGMEPSAPVTIGAFCQSLLNAANAIITLTAFPGAGRRLTMKLELAAQKLNRPELYEAFTALFGGRWPPAETQMVLADWSAAYQAGQSLAGTDRDASLLIHPARRTIYERGFQAQIEADRAVDGMWLMLHTWQALARNLPAESPHADRWVAFLERLNMASSTAFSDKVAHARAYVELATQTVEDWAEKNGA